MLKYRLFTAALLSKHAKEKAVGRGGERINLSCQVCVCAGVQFFSFIRALNDRIKNQPRPQGLLLDDFQNGGSTGEDYGQR